MGFTFSGHSIVTSVKKIMFLPLLICLLADLGIFKKELKGSMKEPNMFHNYETEKITRKASD